MTTSYKAEQLAQRIAEQFELGPPPVDVEYLASLLGVDQIVEALLIEDGRMETLRRFDSYRHSVKFGTTETSLYNRP